MSEEKRERGEQGDRADILSKIGEPYYEEDEDLQRAFDLWYMSDREVAAFGARTNVAVLAACAIIVVWFFWSKP